MTFIFFFFRLYTCLGLDTSLHDDLLNSPDSTNGSPKAKTQKIIHQVSQSDNPTKITIKTFEVPSNHQKHQERDRRKRRQKEFQSPNSDSRIFVTSVNDHTKSNNSSSKNSSSSEGTSNHSNSSSVHGE